MEVGYLYSERERERGSLVFLKIVLQFRRYGLPHGAIASWYFPLSWKVGRLGSEASSGSFQSGAAFRTVAEKNQSTCKHNMVHLQMMITGNYSKSKDIRTRKPRI